MMLTLVALLLLDAPASFVSPFPCTCELRTARETAAQRPTCATTYPQDPPKHKIVPKLTVEERAGGTWVFRVTGTTDLPDGVILKARIFAVDIVDLISGRSEDEQELESKSWTIEVKDGAFDEETFVSSRRPFPVPLRAIVAYQRRDQDGPLARKIGDPDFAVKTDTRVGDPKELETDLRTSARDLYADLVKIRALVLELQTSFTRLREKNDAKAWSAFVKSWYGRVRRLAEGNEARWDVWICWIEKQGRMRVGGFCDRLGKISSECSSWFEGDKKSLERVRAYFTESMEVLEEAFELPGLEIPYDTARVTKELKAYVEAVEALRAIPRDAWAARAPALLARARGTLLALSDRKVVPRRGYELVTALADRFDQLARAAESGADLGKTMEEHDAALRALRSAAQVE